MRLNVISDGLTLIEMILSIALTGALILIGAMALRANHGLWQHAFSRHELEMEAGDVVDLLGGLLRRADPSSMVIESTSEGPWSRLRFAAGPHQYAFYGDHGTLWLKVDDLQPKALSPHLISVQFAAERTRLPTLLTWSLCFGTGNADSFASRVSFSATQFLEQSQE
jgi:type II secretory pathway component PulJ